MVSSELRHTDQDLAWGMTLCSAVYGEENFVKEESLYIFITLKL